MQGPRSGKRCALSEALQEPNFAGLHDFFLGADQELRLVEISQVILEQRARRTRAELYAEGGVTAGVVHRVAGRANEDGRALMQANRILREKRIDPAENLVAQLAHEILQSV